MALRASGTALGDSLVFRQNKNRIRTSHAAHNMAHGMAWHSNLLHRKHIAKRRITTKSNKLGGIRPCPRVPAIALHASTGPNHRVRILHVHFDGNDEGC